MAKKIFIIIFTLLLFRSTNVFAGDIPEAIMEGHQKALFIGKITAINTETYNIIPSTIMMGSVEQSEIQIKKFDKYYGTNNKPETGDFVVVVLLDDDKIDDLWIFKSTSDDYKTLKLVSEKYDMVLRYEKYINEGKYFEAQKKLDESKKVSSTSTNLNTKESTETSQNNKVQSNKPKNLFMALLILIVSAIAFLVIIKFKRIHNN